VQIVKRGISKARQISRRFLDNSRELDRMRRHPSPAVSRIAEAIGRARARHLSPEEAAWVRRLECLRGGVNGSSEMVTIPGPSADGSGTGTRAVELGAYSKLSSKGFPWCLLLFHLVRGLQPRSCLELGTCVGISASYQAAALELNGQGQLLTLEGAPELARLAESHLQEIGLPHRAAVVQGLFQETLTSVLQESQHFDFVYIDGHHQENATWDYYQSISPHIGDGGVLVFDDVDWSPGMERVWKRIRQDDSLTAAIDMVRVGLCVARGGGERKPEQYQVAL
jgi:hypothetical protein